MIPSGFACDRATGAHKGQLRRCLRRPTRGPGLLPLSLCTGSQTVCAPHLKALAKPYNHHSEVMTVHSRLFTNQPC